ncbi:response regulator transcription factor [Paenibacillus pinihumi]|uniref:response regulator transcription factor n=1 Tax=Paenibacillus pinihumi TaxID=669462 RepID=UPI0012B534B4|nr:response regulator transcription factor [Paenibacillus pinihumi]
MLKRYKTHQNLFRLDEHIVLYNQEPVELTIKEFSLLKILIKIRTLRSPERSCLLVWGTDFMGATRTIDVHKTLMQRQRMTNFSSAIHYSKASIVQQATIIHA